MSYRLDDEVYKLVHASLSHMYLDTWGIVRVRVTHMSSIWMLVGAAEAGQSRTLEGRPALLS